MVILAQMGSYVPAEHYACEVIDRIFTRIGASDRLEEGKSTFFIEMEETKSILSYGTNRSLAIIDELGRGTSTFDGMAIAYSVLVDII
jgi:DNA mismatch repair protein MSH6